MPGLERVLRAILKYRATLQPAMVKQFEKIKDNPKPEAVMFSCMDSRLLITRLLQADPGDMFLVRNAGNLVPHSNSLSYDSVTTEPGALELGCVINKIRQVIVCGHSDCKAMNTLFSLKDQVQERSGTPLQLWLKKHGLSSVEKYHAWKAEGGQGHIRFQGETSNHHFDAYIDPENKFAEADKLSQINTLQQIENIASHSILTDLLYNDQVNLNALWFDIYTGDFYMFSREKKVFVKVTEGEYDHLLQDGMCL